MEILLNRNRIFLLLITLSAWSLLMVNVYAQQSRPYTCDDITEISQTECQQLQSIYDLEPDEIDYYTDWFTSPSPCSWEEVECTDNTITTLSIFSINDELLTEIANFPNLTVLSFYDWTGYAWFNEGLDTPSFDLAPLGIMPNLTTLYWDVNGTDFNLSAGQLPNLTKLHYTSLNTDFTADIMTLTNLEYLYFHMIHLTTIPPEIGDLSRLETLISDGSDLTTIPSELSRLSNLTTLEIVDANGVTEVPPEIGQLSNLTTLSVHGTYSLTLPAEIGNLSNLESLSVFSVSVWPETLGSLSNLTELEIWGSGGRLPESYSALSSLTDLSIMRSQMNVDVVETFNLTSLQFEENQFERWPEINSTNLLTVHVLSPVDNIPAQFAQENFPVVVDYIVDPVPTVVRCTEIAEISSEACDVLSDIHGLGIDMAWFDTATPCTWDGVICDGSTIIALAIDYGRDEVHGFVKKLPDNISELSGLTTLTLTYGTVLDGIQTIPNLSELHLNRTELEGNIELISEIPNLTKLQISDHQWWQYLDASPLDVPSGLSFPSLTALTLNNTSGLSSLVYQADMPALQILKIYGGTFIESSESTPDLSTLSEFHMEGTHTSSIPPFVGELPNLSILHINGNQGIVSIPDSIAEENYPSIVSYVVQPELKMAVVEGHDSDQTSASPYLAWHQTDDNGLTHVSFASGSGPLNLYGRPTCSEPTDVQFVFEVVTYQQNGTVLIAIPTGNVLYVDADLFETELTPDNVIFAGMYRTDNSSADEIWEWASYTKEPINVSLSFVCPDSDQPTVEPLGSIQLPWALAAHLTTLQSYQQTAPAVLLTTITLLLSTVTYIQLRRVRE